MSSEDRVNPTERGRSASNSSTGGVEINERESLLGSVPTGRISGGAPATSRAAANNKGCCPNSLGTWLSLIFTLLMAVSILAIKLESDSRFVTLQNQLFSLQKQLDDTNTKEAATLQTLQQTLERESETNLHTLSDLLANQNQSLNHKYAYVWDKISSHDAALIKLTNGTSNAEVLDKLQLTKQQVAAQMSTTKEEIAVQLSEVSRNVSSKIEENNQNLQTTQATISTYLNSTVTNMRSVMTKATSHIYDVQRNVTRAMNQTKINVERTVIELSASVLKAQATIQQEVTEVRDHIELYVAVTNKQFAAENDFVKYQLAGLFTLLSCLIFLWHLTQHIRHFHKPDIQKRITAILWMVPVYGVTSWISMMQPKAENYLATVRDCYEAYVVYTFVAMLVAILGDGKSLDELEIQIAHRITEERREVAAYKAWQVQQRTLALTAAAATTAASTTAATSANTAAGSGIVSTVVMDVENNRSALETNEVGATEEEEEEEGGDISAAPELLPTATPLREPKEHFVPPCPCCYRSHLPLSMATTWLWQCRFLALQFMFVKPLFTVIPLVLQITGAYDVDKIPPWENNTVNWHSAKLYIIAIQNISVGMAFYGLLSFYHGAEKDLEWCDPWPKFLTIKGIVFATFWQSICIQAMSAFGLVDEKAASQISNFLICIEMLIASIAHFYVFPHHEWHPTYQKQRERTLLIQDTMALRDFVQDMRSMMTSRRAASRSDESFPGTANDIDQVTAIAGGQLAAGKEAHALVSSAHSKSNSRDGDSSGDENDEDDEGDEEIDEERGIRMNLLPSESRASASSQQVRRISPSQQLLLLSRSHSSSSDNEHFDRLSHSHGRSEQRSEYSARNHPNSVSAGEESGNDDDAATATGPLSYGMLRASASSASESALVSPVSALTTPSHPSTETNQSFANASTAQYNHSHSHSSHSSHTHHRLPSRKETDPLLTSDNYTAGTTTPLHSHGHHHTVRSSATTPHPHHPQQHLQEEAGGMNRYVQEQLEKKLQLLEAIDSSAAGGASSSATKSVPSHQQHSGISANTTATSLYPQNQHIYYQRGSALAAPTTDHFSPHTAGMHHAETEISPLHNTNNSNNSDNSNNSSNANSRTYKDVDQTVQSLDDERESV